MCVSICYDGSRGFATLYYLGREQDETDTLAKTLAHWEKAIALAERELNKSRKCLKLGKRHEQPD